jgi:MATE family multidrug resistance protein
MVIGLIGLLVNIPTNYIFIYGKFGIPAMGGVGCGVATAIIDWLMFSLLYWYVKKTPSQGDLKPQRRFAWPDTAVLRTLFSLGLPISLSLFFEVTLFTMVALLVAPLGIVAIAGHQIALNFTTLMFMLPMSLGIAVTIRVGYQLGEGAVDGAKTSAYAAIGIGIILASCTAIFTVLFRKPIALLYNDSPEVVIMATQLMLLAAMFQICDAIQVIGNGVLRGYKDTRPIFFITFTAYWIIGLPCGYLLALTDVILPAMGPQGFWIGFIIGLTVSAFLMIYRIFFLQRKSAEHILEYAAR